MSLPAAWVDALFARLAFRYGADWSRKWEGIDIAGVKADWASELGPLVAHPEAISHALANLPDRPPTVSQFKALCIARPQTLKALPEPKADPAVAEAVIAGFKRPDGHDPRAWAHELRRREQACERLTTAQRAMWRAALHQGG